MFTNLKYCKKGPQSAVWQAHKKHFFVLSQAGKPIYSRHGDESRLSALTGLITTLIAFFSEEEDDLLRTMRAGGHQLVFLTKGPIHLVTVSCTGETPSMLRSQLNALYHQIIMTLTAVQLERIFEFRGSYDLRQLISGTEPFMNSLCKAFQNTPSLFLDASRSLRISSRLRDRIARTMLEANPPKTLLFGLLFAKRELVTFLRPKNHTLHPNGNNYSLIHLDCFFFV